MSSLFRAEAFEKECAQITLCARSFSVEDTVISVGNTQIGGGNFAVIAGPCAVESEEQTLKIAEKIKASGAEIFRAGAFKARTSPYSFQGLGEEGLAILRKVKERTGLVIVSEITSPEQLPLFEDVDILQVGARNMQNYELIKCLGKSEKPVLLKRGLSATLTELILSAEYIAAEGNRNIILCERGIRTFEPATRNTLDVSAVPMLKKMTHLPVIADPSHAAGIADLISPLALAATAAGADGLMIEVHTNPECSISDGAQAITPAQFNALYKKVLAVRQVI